MFVLYIMLHILVRVMTEKKKEEEEGKSPRNSQGFFFFDKAIDPFNNKCTVHLNINPKFTCI